MPDTRIITYEADDTLLKSTLYMPVEPRQPCAAILVFPEAPGLGSYIHRRAQELAEIGYAALACDLHGDARFLTDMEEMKAHVLALLNAPSRMRARGQGALDAVASALAIEPCRIAAIGYCFGGAMALELGRGGADIAGIVGFHCTLGTQSDREQNRLRCPVLAVIGADDPMVDMEQRRNFEDEMKYFGVDWQLHVYGGVRHAFTNPDADRLGRPEFARYDAKADARSWSAMLGFFAEIFA